MIPTLLLWIVIGLVVLTVCTILYTFPEYTFQKLNERDESSTPLFILDSGATVAVFDHKENKNKKQNKHKKEEMEKNNVDKNECRILIAFVGWKMKHDRMYALLQQVHTHFDTIIVMAPRKNESYTSETSLKEDILSLKKFMHTFVESLQGESQRDPRQTSISILGHSLGCYQANLCLSLIRSETWVVDQCLLVAPILDLPLTSFFVVGTKNKRMARNATIFFLVSKVSGCFLQTVKRAEGCKILFPEKDMHHALSFQTWGDKLGTCDVHSIEGGHVTCLKFITPSFFSNTSIMKCKRKDT